MTVIPFTLAAAAAADTPLETVFKVIIAAAPAVIGVTAGVFAGFLLTDYGRSGGNDHFEYRFQRR
ncbi:hypothetical protein, partial [Victivallis lenta]|uniref:hypothetical protein n=1 Tax=Victivallis lenta TaxID=2606640 RepID=UPI003AF2EC25